MVILLIHNYLTMISLVVVVNTSDFCFFLNFVLLYIVEITIVSQRCWAIEWVKDFFVLYCIVLYSSIYIAPLNSHGHT